ncbi:uncharacterized protein LOC101454014 [Ceratitis capitata]|uniref:(Mediterranean fruit fly) hypothetical protein n=1 Tax=Ceratitis capitata TaxID=7213 RepID=A0A811UDM5_CERCA|nr:uncharacterized protein LOC101454014 [Ceratitis capitata]CAD6996710.1 unnamed protein product [Ceratitis capitata]
MRCSHCGLKSKRKNSCLHLYKPTALPEVERKTFKFKPNLMEQSRTAYDKVDIPIEFKVSPESLLHLAARVLDALPLPDVFGWTNDDVCNWLRCLDYAHYEHTFRLNSITGRKLLLIDSNTLCAMNIKNFNDIKHLTHAIRQLFHTELTSLLRSVALNSQNICEMYKFSQASGYDHLRRSDILCKLGFMREKSKYLCHWDILESWLSRSTVLKQTELFGAR